MLNWKTGWQWLRVILATVLICGLILYSYNNREELAILARVSWQLLSVLFFLMYFSILAGSIQSVNLYRAIGAPVGIWEGFGLAVVAAATSLLFPHASYITKAVYLKKKYKLPYSQTPAIFLGHFVVFLLVGAIVMTSSNLISMMLGYTVPTILWVGVIVAAASVSIFWFEIPMHIAERLGRIGNMLHLFSAGWKKLRSNKTLLIQASLFQLLSFIINGFIISVAYQSLSLTVHPLSGTSMAVFISFSNLIMITPGNIGVQEIVYGYLSELSGVVFVQGVAVSGLIRVVGWVTLLVAAPFCWYFLFFRQNLSFSQLNESES